jgi:hypothetical protein
MGRDLFEIIRIFVKGSCGQGSRCRKGILVFNIMNFTTIKIVIFILFTAGGTTPRGGALIYTPPTS